MVCRRHVSRISFCHWGFLLFFLSLPLPQLSVFGEGKGLRWPLRPQSHLRQMKQPLSISSSLPPLFSSIPLLPSLNDVFLAGLDEPNARQLFLMHRGWGLWLWAPRCVCERLFVPGVNIGVKRRGHTDHWLGGQRRRESNYVHCAKHKSTLVGRITTASYLAVLCLPFFVNSQHRSQAYTLYVYVFPGLVYGCHSMHLFLLR